MLAFEETNSTYLEKKKTADVSCQKYFLPCLLGVPEVVKTIFKYDKGLSLILVGLLWGATNPFIRLGSKGIDQIQSDSKIHKFVLEIWFLVTRWQYIIPFILNQSGSILYFLTLQNTNLSLAVPIANALSFVFTAVVAHFLGETPATKNIYIGTVLVICGSTMCLLDKFH